MVITEEFNKAIADKDIRMIRIMLKDSLVVDPTLTEFNMMTSIAEKRLEGLYDDHDGEKLNFDTSTWNKDYMDTQMFQVVYNFSKERLKLLKSICQYLYKSRVEKNKNAFYKSKEANNFTKKQFSKVIIISGLAVIAMGIAISTPVAIVFGVLAVVAGGILIILGV